MMDKQNPIHSTSQHPRLLRYEIFTLLFIKALALCAIYWVFFGPSMRPTITAPVTAAHLLAPASGQTH